MNEPPVSNIGEQKRYPVASVHGLSWMEQTSRQGRLILKELREIFRDRRTLLTLFLMPVLLYPLLGMAMQQFALSGAASALSKPVYRIGFIDAKHAEFAVAILMLDPGRRDAKKPTSKQQASEATNNGAVALSEGPQTPELRYNVLPREQMSAELRRGDYDVIVEIVGGMAEQPSIDPRDPLKIDIRISSVDGDRLGEEVVEFLSEKFKRAGLRMLEKRLALLQVPQRAEPIGLEHAKMTSPRNKQGSPLASILPLVLILMTVTGAVYPAIDLTAGERERGTLEMLMAAPIPRLAVLFAKYIAVLAVAMATACVNLSAAAATLYLTDVGRALLGTNGFSVVIWIQALAAVMLFTAFFAALLLAVASFARSFKEAQAYLIPLMLLALAPGVASLFPSVALTPATAAMPILNTVLFARELLGGRWDAGLTSIVLAANFFYAAGALGVAARLFGSEGVLYGNEGGWRQMTARPDQPAAFPPASAGTILIALAVPGFILLSGIAARWGEGNFIAQLLAGAVTTIIVFAGLPLVAQRHWNTTARTTFALVSAPPLLWMAALLWGASLWPFALAARSAAFDFSALELDPSYLQRLEELVDQIRRTPLPARLILLALIPAVCEELFFRGFVFGAFRRFGAPVAVITTAFVFGAFHMLSPGGLTADRGPPTFVLGLALGLLRAASGSLWPGMAAHMIHNGLIVSVVGDPALLQPFLDVSKDSITILPHTIRYAGGAAAVGLVFAYFGRRRNAA